MKHVVRKRSLIGPRIYLTLLAGFFLVPPFSMLVTSLKSSAELGRLSANPWWVAEGVSFEHYRYLLHCTEFPRHLWNSLAVSLPVVIITLIIAVPAAYALTRIRFCGDRLVFNLALSAYLIPPTLLFIPLFDIITSVGLINSKWSLVLVLPALAAPFCTWIIGHAMAALPRELDDAARCDGASHWQLMVWVLIPPIAPALVAASVYAFAISWGAYVYPLTFIISSDQMVLTTGLTSRLIRGDIYHWGSLMAGAVLAILPPILLYQLVLAQQLKRA